MRLKDCYYDEEKRVDLSFFIAGVVPGRAWLILDANDKFTGGAGYDPEKGCPKCGHPEMRDKGSYDKCMGPDCDFVFDPMNWIQG